MDLEDIVSSHNYPHILLWLKELYLMLWRHLVNLN